MLNRLKTNTNPGSRRAVSLAEVLIAMGIMTLGLLGVASLFPVGGYYMQSGDTYDRAGEVAQAALDDAIVRGHLDPNNWVVHDVTTTLGPNNGAFIELVSGRYQQGTFLPWQERMGLKDSLAVQQPVSVFNIAKTSAEAFRSEAFGSAYVIDPMGVGEYPYNEGGGNGNNFSVASPAPSMAVRSFPALSLPIAYNSPSWGPWRGLGFYWPVRRVTTVHSTRELNTNVTLENQRPIARALFSTENDLALSLPDNGDTPARLRWRTWTDGSTNTNGARSAFPASRQERGDYSWIISVSPGTSEARDSLATRPDAHPMEVSVVVFHKRLLGAGSVEARRVERLVEAKVVSTGPSGGELLLEQREAERDGPDVTTSPFEELRPGQFVMLCGPHPQSTGDNPMFVMRWYRVLSVEDEGTPALPDDDLAVDKRRLSREGEQDDPNGAVARVLVSLRGPDWPWLPARSGNQIDLDDETLLSNDLRVAILPGAVAVHTKTMRLEAGSLWSAD